MSEPRTTHVLLECWGCDDSVLGSKDRIFEVVSQAAEVIGTQIVTSLHHRTRSGICVTAVLQDDAHIVIHTWPEDSYAAIDVYAPNEFNTNRAVGVVKKGLGSFTSNALNVDRGQGANGSMRVHV